MTFIRILSHKLTQNISLSTAFVVKQFSRTNENESNCCASLRCSIVRVFLVSYFSNVTTVGRGNCSIAERQWADSRRHRWSLGEIGPAWSQTSGPRRRACVCPQETFLTHLLKSLVQSYFLDETISKTNMVSVDNKNGILYLIFVSVKIEHFNCCVFGHLIVQANIKRWVVLLTLDR